MSRPNEDARPEPGARKMDSWTQRSQPQSAATGNGKDYEDRRNAAACFRNQRKTEDWHADFLGVMVVEGLRDGDKVWVRVNCRKTRRGDDYLTVTLKRQS
jgi:hypothetical protein